MSSKTIYLSSEEKFESLLKSNPTSHEKIIFHSRVIECVMSHSLTQLKGKGLNKIAIEISRIAEEENLWWQFEHIHPQVMVNQIKNGFSESKNCRFCGKIFGRNDFGLHFCSKKCEEQSDEVLFDRKKTAKKTIDENPDFVRLQDLTEKTEFLEGIIEIPEEFYSIEIPENCRKLRPFNYSINKYGRMLVEVANECDGWWIFDYLSPADVLKHIQKKVQVHYCDTCGKLLRSVRAVTCSRKCQGASEYITNKRMQTAERLKNRWFSKYYEHGGYNVQGYEPAVIDYLLENGIEFSTDRKGFPFFLEGKKRHYFPDFILEDGVIEVKSPYTLEKGIEDGSLLAKAKGIVDAGLKFRLALCSNRTSIAGWYEYDPETHSLKLQE